MSPYARLMRHYRNADAATLARGAAWYAAAHDLMVSLAAETGHTLEQAVAVMAITSPGAQLATNLRWTREALESRGATRVGRFPNAMAPKIAAVLDSPDAAAEYVRGPKVGPFFRAILGDEDALVLDRWAFFAAGHADRDSIPGPVARRKIDADYRRAAAKVGMTVRAFQAAIWIQVRESTPKSGGIAVRYADIV